MSEKKRGRWDQTPDREEQPTPKRSRTSKWDQEDPSGTTTGASSSSSSGWDQATPVRTSKWDETPVTAPGGSSKWDETPVAKKKSKWDETPTIAPGAATPSGASVAGMATPAAGSLTPAELSQYKLVSEVDDKNRFMTDEELDAILPTTGYKIVEPPANYVPKRVNRYASATPTPLSGSQSPAYYQMPEQASAEQFGEVLIPQSPSLQGIVLKPDDVKHFGKILEQEMTEEEEETLLTPEERKERKIMMLLLKIKNGTPPLRKQALRQITDKAREFGPGPLFNQILPLLMSPSLEDQERHLLVKVIDRILYKLDELVRPYVPKILVVIEPLLIDEDYYARVEGREIISNLAKAAGLATMIATMRPNIDNPDEYVRNTTARAFAVVASALGIPSLLPFLKAVCQSKKSWQARHTGIKIIQHIAIQMGCAILPHLKQLVDIVESGLRDTEPKVKTITALAVAALAEAAHPYGIESFDSVLKPLWVGVHKNKSKSLAAFLKAVGYIIPLMNAEHASLYAKNVMDVVVREFSSNDDEMKKIVLKVVKQCVSTEGIEAGFVKEKILPSYFKSFWIRRMALDKRNYKQVVETTVELANNVGASEIISRIVNFLRDDAESFRRMVMETIQKIIQNLGVADIGPRLESLLIDGSVFAFQEQTTDDNNVALNGFGAIMNALGARCKPYLPEICAIITVRLNNKSAKMRQQAADLISKIAPVLKTCDEDKTMSTLGGILYEYLGEEYPEVLGSILGALKAIVNVVGMEKMNPPIRDLLPRLTPILKNRHEKVQENCIDLVGRIADRGCDYIPPREWMRICFELLELLKAHKKAIRRAAVNTFGYIAKGIGPHDVLATLLNNLKVQERQMRVCTTVAIAIVAETCSPFTVLPALMNEYRVPELNVQNGVLKSLSFLFEYIGEMAKDYIYAVVPLLEDALTDRDLVHRQTACTVVKHLALGCHGANCEDALLHLLNLVWPNIFETSPHVINAVMEAVEGLRVGLGPAKLMQYCIQGLFHPARKVRNTFWKIYNNLYIGAQDALIPVYPKIDDDAEHTFNRQELELFL